MSVSVCVCVSPSPPPRAGGRSSRSAPGPPPPPLCLREPGLRGWEQGRGVSSTPPWLFSQLFFFFLPPTKILFFFNILSLPLLLFLRSPVPGINRTEPRCCFSVPSGRLSCHPSPRGDTHTPPPVSRSSRQGPSSPPERGRTRPSVCPHPQERALSGRGLPLFFSCLGCKYCRGAGLTQTSYRIP